MCFSAILLSVHSILISISLLFPDISTLSYCCIIPKNTNILKQYVEVCHDVVYVSRAAGLGNKANCQLYVVIVHVA